MATVKMIPEEEALGRVKEIYDEIKDQLGIDFVPKGRWARVPGASHGRLRRGEE